MGKVKAYSSRSRSGCATCKKRRLKCDETHPKCLKCLKLKLSCSYEQTLTWEDDAVERGVTFGRSLEARQRKKTHAKSDISVEIGQFDMRAHRDATIKRQSYLFVSFIYGDFAKWYDLIGVSGKKHEHGGEPCFAINTKKVIRQNISEAPVVELEEPTILENNEEIVLPFSSNLITRAFSSPKILSNSPNTLPSPILKIDDVFLDSFSSSHLVHLSPQSTALEPSFLSSVQHTDNDNENSDLGLTSFEKHLLVYFVESIGPYCVCYPRIQRIHSLEFLIHVQDYKVSPELNPYLYLIVPLALRSPLVLKALIASTAKQLVLLGQEYYEVTAKRYSFEVLKELPQIILEKQSNNEKNWDDVLATMIMLCFTEILVRCDSSWLIHLNGAKQFLKESCIQNNLSLIGKFFVRYFISHEIMAETAWMYDSDQPSLLQIHDDARIETLKNDADTKIDLVLGCSPYLISLIHKISVLGKCFEDLELESGYRKDNLESEILYRADMVEDSLINLKPESPELEETDQNAIRYIETIAEIKKMAALIYLFARIQLEYQFRHNPNNIKFDKVKLYIKKIINLHAILPGIYVSLLWPIFIVGIFATTEEERWFVLSSMTEMEKHRELSSVKSAKRVVSSIWKEHDLRGSPATWKEIMRDKANTISLA
ncbi:hypothetical protein PACTADRAFT_16410 [Pachysolen tannophilus NRRL Y-2460]|uniref:Zn(2)-C6 fungal-type domain-containing protein n=1 Tax=Pachysolen tannophilus NRRL Y-2460 TaxID=669874 RepID=A0A1E4TX83_PACTA|nr:hypothetical protein PACTADRAFT_16410 [Pachysolen tannophilus NRRL Y-2460]